MEGGLSDRALKVLRTELHEKVGMNPNRVPDPALVADQLSLMRSPAYACETATAA